MRISVFLLCLLLTVTGCTKKTEEPTTPTIPTPTEPTVPPPTITPITDIVKASSCVKYSWKNRGVAPIGYMKGVALTYARSVCRYRSPNTTPAGTMGKTLGAASVDALAHYELDATTGLERLKRNYTLLIGLGMRESSGNYGEGRDMSANNVSAETAETGLFQFSYNLHSASPMLEVLYAEYQKNPEMCMEDVFKEGVKKAFNNNYSYNASASNQAYQQQGLEFQKFARKCPAFSTEYTAVGVRMRRAHWGPINRKEAEYKQECYDMLTKVEQATVCN